MLQVPVVSRINLSAHPRPQKTSILVHKSLDLARTWCSCTSKDIPSRQHMRRWGGSQSLDRLVLAWALGVSVVVSYGASSWCKGVVYWCLKSIGFCDLAWGVGAWGSQTAGMGYLDLFRPSTASTVLLNDISGRFASISSTMPRCDFYCS